MAEEKRESFLFLWYVSLFSPNLITPAISFSLFSECQASKATVFVQVVYSKKFVRIGGGVDFK